MINEMKKVMLAGIGIAADTYEKAEKIVDDMVQKGKITLDEGKELSEELKRDFKGKAKTATEVVNNRIDDLKPVTKDDLMSLLEEYDKVKKQEIDILRNRIDVLEEKIKKYEENISR